MIGLRTDNEVDERRPLDQQLALSLSYAAGDRQYRLAPGSRTPGIAQLAHPAELGKHLLRRLLADVTGIQDDQISVVGLVRDRVAMQCQGLRHTIGIVHVHLAAVSFDEEFLRHVTQSARFMLADTWDHEVRLQGA